MRGTTEADRRTHGTVRSPRGAEHFGSLPPPHTASSQDSAARPTGGSGAAKEERKASSCWKGGVSYHLPTPLSSCTLEMPVIRTTLWGGHHAKKLFTPGKEQINVRRQKQLKERW